MRGHGGYVTDTTWNRDGSLVMSSADNGTIHAFSPRTGRCVWIALPLADGQAALFSGAGELLWASSKAEEQLVYAVEKADQKDVVDLLTLAEFRQRLGAPTASTRSPGVNPGISPTSAPATVDPNRRVAEWVLSKGGTVNVDGAKQDIRAAGDLPPGTFQLTGIGMWKVQLKDDDLQNLQGLTNLEGVNLGPGITDAGLRISRR